jgi:hypothetical protein
MRTRLTQREMIREAAEMLGGKCSYTEIRDYIRGRYGPVNKSAITANIIMCTVNHPSRIHYPPNAEPRLADTKYDFLFRTARGVVELYDRHRHGEWEIRRTEHGGVVVAQVGGEAFPTAAGMTVEGRGPVPPPPADEIVIRIPSKETFLRGISEYERREKRDSMYKVATFVLSHFWGNPADMADGLGVLLLTWNQAFYRYGTLDFDRLERCIGANLETIDSFRRRDISSLSTDDEEQVIRLFDDFLEALEIDSGGSQGKRSPVAVSKALHLLAPGFFPLWDDKIARQHGCHYSADPAGKYVDFSWITKAIADVVGGYVDNPSRTIVKLIDQYNYSRFTRGWM